MSRLGGRLGEKPFHSESRLGRQRRAGSTATYIEGHNDVAIGGHCGCMDLNVLLAPAGARRGYGDSDDAVDAADLKTPSRWACALWWRGEPKADGAPSANRVEISSRAGDSDVSTVTGRVWSWRYHALRSSWRACRVQAGQKAPATRGRLPNQVHRV